jgi:hypothetical protein
MLRIASLTLIIGAVLLMTWVLDSANARPRRDEPAVQIADLRRPSTPAVEDIESDVNRLRARLPVPTKYPQPSRDPFRFGRDAEPPRVEAPQPVNVATPPPVLPRLVAILSDTSSGGPMRRAALGLGANVRILSVGDTVGSFRVAAITADDVELVDTVTGATFRVSLR